MLDTIALTLDHHQFEVRDPHRFSPSAEGLLIPPYYRLGSRGKFSCVQNPTRAELDAGRHLPRLTLAKKKVTAGFALTLRIEFSAPKLVFGNNFDELSSCDFERVLAALHRSLGAMSVVAAEDALRAARVSAIHYSKNVALTDFTTCSMVMRELERVDLDRRLDLVRTDYRNEGHAIRYHSNSFEVVFYDKLKDLEQARLSEKRAIEFDYSRQTDLFVSPSCLMKPLEVLRMEIRLGTRAKIGHILRKLRDKRETTFAALFDESLAKDVLLLFWTEIQKQTVLLGPTQTYKPEELLACLAKSATQTMRPGLLLQQLGFLLLVRSIGFRGARAILSRHCSQRSWQRLKRGLKGLPLLQSAGFSALGEVSKALDAFAPLRMEVFRLHRQQQLSRSWSRC